MAIKKDDKVQSTLQRDGSFNVVIDMKSAEHGEKRVVANVKDPDAYYTRVRYDFDNPPVETRQDLEEEKEMLMAQRSKLDTAIDLTETKIRGL